jgi:hypothetical protein
MTQSAFLHLRGNYVTRLLTACVQNVNQGLLRPGRQAERCGAAGAANNLQTIICACNTPVMSRAYNAGSCR